MWCQISDEPWDHTWHMPVLDISGSRKKKGLNFVAEDPWIRLISTSQALSEPYEILIEVISRHPPNPKRNELK